MRTCKLMHCRKRMDSRRCTSLLSSWDDTIVAAIQAALTWICIRFEFTSHFEILTARACASVNTIR